MIHKATLTTPAPEPGEDAKMAVKYEDNFGFWEIDCPDEHAFFEYVKSQSIRAICQPATGWSGSCLPKLCALLASLRSNAAHPGR